MKKMFQSLFTLVPSCPPDLQMEEHLTRFQCQAWYVRLWRYRYYLSVPLKATRAWISDHTRDDGRKEPFSLFWHLSVSLAQCPMKWYYTMFETFGKLQKDFFAELDNNEDDEDNEEDCP